ncbi:MAG TPA: hypothetical protein VJ732_15165 [Bryobacteraceae bacterium]|nr:hypothetical protein [Bryobacteraceae bacterium]
MKVCKASLFLLLTGILFRNCLAQGFDNSGNSLLKGNYFLRQVVFSRIGGDGTNGRARSILGTATFDGAGGYTFKGQLMDTDAASAQPVAYSANGTYSAAANGLIQMTNPVDNQFPMYGEASGSALVASSSGGSDSDLLVAIPGQSSGLSDATLKGTYRVSELDLLYGKSQLARDAFFLLTSTGGGTFNDFTISGNAANVGQNPVSEQVTGATYSVSAAGSGTASFPLPGTLPVNSSLISGVKTIYVSADGNILLGGSPSGYDLLVGVRNLATPATNSNLQGLYYVGGLQIDRSAVAGGGSPAWSSYSGSFNASGQGTSIWHQRLQQPGESVVQYTFDSKYGLSADGSVIETDYQYGVGAGGQGFVLSGNGQNFGVAFGVSAPAFSGSGVFLNPAGVANAASFAPITNPVAPGELLSLYGSGLAPGTATAPGASFPNLLSGVQVLMNGVPAPLYFVSPGQISALVPYEATDGTGYMRVQVINNGVKSNVVTVYADTTAPGVFTLPPGGSGLGAILHADYTVVSDQNPAHPGEVVLVFLTGLGDVNNPVPDGAPGSSDPLSTALAESSIYIDGQPASVLYEGLAPQLVGLYQVNVQVPQQARSGAVYLDISSPTAYHSQARISISH